MHVAAEHLVLLVAEHLGGGGIDDGDIALKVDAEDAVTDGLEDGVGLTGKRAEPAFGADLLADVDAEAEDVCGTVLELDELVAVGDGANIAIAVAEVQQTLGFAGLVYQVEVSLERVDDVLPE